MHDIALLAAGVLGIAAAIIHGVLGETRIFPTARIEPAWARRLIRVVWLCSAIAWLCTGVLLIAAPYLGSEVARYWIVGASVVIYGAGAAANAWATRARHYGWMILAAACVLALAGVAGTSGR